MRDLVKGVFSSNGGAVLCKQGSFDSNEGGDHVLIENFAEYDDAIAPLDRMQVHNFDMRRLNILRPPIVFRSAIDNVPMQIIFCDHLWRYSRLFDEGPDRAPLTIALDHSQVANFAKRPH